MPDYTCKLCSRTFPNSQSINSHVRHCRLAKEGKTWVDVATSETLDKFKHLSVILTKERPKCLSCGKSVGELRGLFCSSVCAAKVNAKGRIHSQETKDKISAKLRRIPLQKTCEICNKTFRPKMNKRRTCSPLCGAKLGMITRPMKERTDKPMGGIRPGCDRNYRTGYYRGVYCASSYELVFVVHCFNQLRNVKRCRTVLTFEWNGKRAKYYPDFEIDGVIYEIKGYFRSKDAAKLSANPSVILVGKQEILNIKSSDPVLSKLSWERIPDLYEVDRPTQ